ncbi:PR domain zinc finger protein 5-like [Artemia franciscana]|uniref:PR domain zinc finger protein 5-like n=1 Tax=Artemia franciscana TaxID=6661 RepID=UPI0032DAC26A
MNTNVEDDRHVCFKCHVIIDGLDNYVAHRQRNCIGLPPENIIGASVVIPSGNINSESFHLASDIYFAPPRSQSASDLLLDNDLKAEDFFSMLELQRQQNSPSGSRKRQKNDPRNLIDPQFSITDIWYDTVNHEHFIEDFSDIDVCQELEFASESPTKKSHGKDYSNNLSGIETQKVCTSFSQLCKPSQKLQKFRGKWMPGDEKDLIAHEEEEFPCSSTMEPDPVTQSSFENIESVQNLEEETGISNVLESIESSFESIESVQNHEEESGIPKVSESTGSSFKNIESVQNLEEESGIPKALVPKVDFPHLACSARKPRKGDITCTICFAKVPKHLFGKHLLSMYHYRHSKRKIKTNEVLILENIEKIVKECAYQCAMCRFYCNSDIDFQRHWNSPVHMRKDSKVSGIYVCSACNFESYFENFSQHLISREHEERSAIVFQCVPIVIRKRQEFECENCIKKFNLRVILKRHKLRCQKLVSSDILKADLSLNVKNQSRLTPVNDRDSSHKSVRILESSSFEKQCIENESSDYFLCSYCTFRTLQGTVLRRHLAENHNEKSNFHCFICKLNFASQKEVVYHRKSQEHREKSELFKNGKHFIKNCSHCYSTFDDIPSLREHIKEEHSDLMAKCYICKERFPFKQDLVTHRKFCKAPTDTNPEMRSGTGQEAQPDCQNCHLCNLSFEDEQSLMLHTLLAHSDPTRSNSLSNKDNSQMDTQYFCCPKCETQVERKALKRHISSHFSDSRFSCAQCKRKFENQERLNSHLSHHKQLQCEHPGCDYSTCYPSLMTRHKERHGEAKYPCNVCGKSFRTR